MSFCGSCRGDTNTQYLRDHGVSIWDEWATEDGDLGPLYGAQWRSWPTPDGRTIDQLTQVVESIKVRPNSETSLGLCMESVVIA